MTSKLTVHLKENSGAKGTLSNNTLVPSQPFSEICFHVRPKVHFAPEFTFKCNQRFKPFIWQCPCYIYV